MLIYLFPAGVFLCFRELRDEHVFVIVYSVLASYFAGVMVRLMLVLTPVVCITAAMAVSHLYDSYLDPVENQLEKEGEDGVNGDAASIASQPAVTASPEPKAKSKKGKAKAKADSSTSTSKSTVDAALGSQSSLSSILSTPANLVPGIPGLDTRVLLIGVFTTLAVMFVLHCTWVTSTAYSSPSVVLASRAPDGSQNIIDDFREAYYWLRQNTKPDAKIASWWDYGGSPF